MGPKKSNQSLYTKALLTHHSRAMADNKRSKYDLLVVEMQLVVKAILQTLPKDKKAEELEKYEKFIAEITDLLERKTPEGETDVDIYPVAINPYLKMAIRKPEDRMNEVTMMAVKHNNDRKELAKKLNRKATKIFDLIGRQTEDPHPPQVIDPLDRTLHIYENRLINFLNRLRELRSCNPYTLDEYSAESNSE